LCSTLCLQGSLFLKVFLGLPHLPNPHGLSAFTFCFSTFPCLHSPSYYGSLLCSLILNCPFSFSISIFIQLRHLTA
jgi:hypothetical protein